MDSQATDCHSQHLSLSASILKVDMHFYMIRRLAGSSLPGSGSDHLHASRRSGHTRVFLTPFYSRRPSSFNVGRCGSCASTRFPEGNHWSEGTGNWDLTAVPKLVHHKPTSKTYLPVVHEVRCLTKSRAPFEHAEGVRILAVNQRIVNVDDYEIVAVLTNSVLKSLVRS